MIKTDKRLKANGYLPINKIIQIFSWLFKSKIGYTLCEEKLAEYARELCRTEGPIIVEDEDYTFWLDKYYIAYSEGKKAEYVYWTKEFLMEEINSMRDVLWKKARSGLGLCREIKTMAKGLAGDYYLLPQYKARLARLEHYKRAIQ